MKMKAGPSAKMVQSGGMRLCLTRWNIGNGGKPLVFLNGLGADASSADRLLKHIEGREIWTIDMPGTGKSPDCLWPYTVQSMATAIIGIAQQFYSGPIDLAGFSWGGALAQQIAGQYPEKIDKLILLATASQMNPADMGWGAALDRDIRNQGLRIPSSTPMGLAYQSLAMAGWNNKSLLSRIKHHSILILSGAMDRVVTPAASQILAKAFQSSQHHILPGAHLFPFARSRETAVLMADFLNNPVQAGAGENSAGIAQFA